MCGRFFVPEDDSEEELTEIISILQRRAGPSAVKLGEVFPSDQAAVLANNRVMEVRPFAMRWGYSFPDNRPIINARIETAAVKPLFKDGMLQRRCLVPASTYYEWEKEAVAGHRKQKYSFKPTGTSLFFMAGIYHMEKGEPCFTILTRDAAPGIAKNHDRMPVILPQDAQKDWLNLAYNAEEVAQAAQLQMDFCSA